MKCYTIARLILYGLAAVASLTMTDTTATSAEDSKILGLPQEHALATVPLGDLAGGAQSNAAAHISNPQQSDVQEGKELFVRLNCADCHGFTAKGAMGPSLVDKYWRYGGTPPALYKSIFEGRPKGMPAWGKALSPKDIWQLVAYIESLGGSFPLDFYQPSLQGDRQKELVAPELNFEEEINGSPRYEKPSSSAGNGEQNGSQKQ